MQKIIFDTDPGVDDALALMLLAKSNFSNILAITTTAGNSTIENTTANAQYLKKLLKLNSTIYSGARDALTGPFTTAKVHGSTGLFGIEHQETPNITNDASQMIAKIVRENPGEVTIICIGPQTNLAKAIIDNPDLPKLIKEVIIMGGTYLSPGNKTSVAEFNICLDPEAAEIVFESEIKKTVIPLDVCYQTPLFMEDFNKISGELSTTVLSLAGPYIKALSKFEGQDGAIVYDALAVYYLLNPQAFKTEDYEVHIETSGKYSRGQMIVDRRAWGEKKPNVTMVISLDRSQFVTDFLKILSR